MIVSAFDLVKKLHGMKQPKLAPLRAIGKPAGTYVSDLAANRKAILLCELCNHKFDHKKAQYYKDRMFVEFVGNCDGCREHTFFGSLYVHESCLTDPGGRSR